MQSRRWFLIQAAAVTSLAAYALMSGRMRLAIAADSTPGETFAVQHSDEQWHQLLSDEAFDVLRRAGTERPYSSPLNNEHRSGRFACAGCQLPLFSSSAKFDSGTGWPSFTAPLAGAVNVSRDTTLGMERNEVHCHRCGGHLGHVFDDGPAPTGLRYCMNGVAMAFTPGTA